MREFRPGPLINHPKESKNPVMLFRNGILQSCQHTIPKIAPLAVYLTRAETGMCKLSKQASQQK
jgi:hypothetical protein